MWGLFCSSLLINTLSPIMDFFQGFALSEFLIFFILYSGIELRINHFPW